MKSVAFLINGLTPGGAERVFLNDANMFARRGYKVLFCILYESSSEQSFERELDDSIECYHVRAKSPFDIFAALRIARRCRAHGTQRLLSTLNDANLIGRLVVIMSTGRIRLFLREANDPRHKPWWQKGVSFLFDGLATNVIAVTSQVRTQLLRNTPWRGKKIAVLHNGIEVPPLMSHTPNTPVRILAVGNLTNQKDYPTLVAAFSELKKQNIPYEAVIVGGGAVAGLREQAEPLRAQVRFTGALPHEKVEKEFQHADIFVLSSKWEGCPNVILEAMAHGLPVVATSVGGVPELVVDSTTGLLVPSERPDMLADALARLVTDASLRDTLGAAGYKRAHDVFSSESRFAQLESILFPINQ